jgi:hypothetical protein
MRMTMRVVTMVMRMVMGVVVRMTVARLSFARTRQAVDKLDGGHLDLQPKLSDLPFLYTEKVTGPAVPT